jgi:hypothetical protein
MEVIQLSSPEDRLLTRQEASHYLGTLGIRRSPATLAKLFCMRSDGPPCVHHGRKPLYPRRLLLAWAEAQLTGVRHSSSEPRLYSEAGYASL